MRNYPKPNLKELPGLYAELDTLTDVAEKAIRSLPIYAFDSTTEIVSFSKMNESDFEKLINTTPSTMVIVFTRVCGLSDREFHRLYQLQDVYRLRKSWKKDAEARRVFIKAVKELLPHEMYLETLLFTFYKMWEEHQRRHHRARFEKDVRSFFLARGYECSKITRPTEVDAAIPPKNPEVVIQVRTGVRKDLVKRAKEFSAEFERSIEAFPNSKFMVIFKVVEHELEIRAKIKEIITNERKGKKEYDAVFFQDELPAAIKLLENWRITKSGNPLVQFSEEDITNYSSRFRDNQ